MKLPVFNFPKVLFIFILLALVSCKTKEEPKEEIMVRDYPEIRKLGKIIATTDFNSTSYFIYKGTPMGFQYELLKIMAEDLGLELEIKVNNDLEEAFKQLQENTCDLLAINLTVTIDRQELMSFTSPIGQSRQVLIQKKPDGWEKMSRFNVENQLIRNQLDLANKTIHVMNNSAYAERLRNLEKEIGDSIRINEVENFDEEQLIGLVAKGEINYTVADEEVARLNQTYLPILDVATAVSFPQNHAWAVNKNAPELLKEINQWIGAFKGTARYNIIYNKYFKDNKASRRATSEFLSVSGGKISIYDDLIKKYAATINWDWRLLASLIYQESRFDHNARSWVGAFGLMQLMPPTAKRFGASKTSKPEVNIQAGTRFIKWLDNQLRDVIVDDQERIHFILGSYNAGMGHILDARRLTEANGKDPNVWYDNVDYFILNKSNPQYYDIELVKYGYLRGEETYNYVRKIMDRYASYKELIN